MALGVQTQLGTRGYYSQKYLDSKNAFSQLKQRVTPFVEQEVKSKLSKGKVLLLKVQGGQKYLILGMEAEE